MLLARCVQHSALTAATRLSCPALRSPHRLNRHDRVARRMTSTAARASAAQQQHHHLMDAAAVQLENAEKPSSAGASGGPAITDAPPAAPALQWTALGVPPEELTLDFCLPTGQTFRFHKEPQAEGRYIGVLGQRLVRMQQGVSDVFYVVLARAEGALPGEDDAAVRDFFNLPPGSCAGAATRPEEQGGASSTQGQKGVTLRDLSVGWRQACQRYAHLSPYIPGARMLRQPPLECLFSFICSSNNHISRIHGMVQRLCQAYGTPLLPTLPLDTPMPPLPSGQTLPANQENATLPPTDPAPEQHEGRAGGNPSTKRQRRTSRSPSPPPPVAAPTEQQQAGDPPPAALQGHQHHPALLNPPTDPTAAPADPPASSKGKQQQPGSKQPKAAAKGSKRGRASASASDAAATTAASDGQPAEDGEEGAGAGASAGVSPSRGGGGAVGHLGPFFAFPSLDQLASHATEEVLRAAGFGYRAKFIVGTAAALQAQEGGGEAWLMGLREVPYAQAAASLEELPGVGPKVAACVCLFSLDKHEAIPVDTHVWQIATKYYLPALKGKALTKKVHGDVQAAFTQRFGAYAGWAHNAMFIAELAAHKHRIPPLPR